MLSKSTVVLLGLLVCYVNARCLGQIPIVGEETTYIMTDATGVEISGSKVTIKYNNGADFTKECANDFTPTSFRPFYLLDKTFGFTADMSSISCGCNAALYLSKMPAYNQNQQPDPTTCGNYYCDANKVCGAWCPEMDIMEANRASMAVTPHKCDPPTGKYYSHCDGAGCSLRTKDMGDAYGYGANFKINTNDPFNVSMSFRTQSGQLSTIVTVLSQGNRQVNIVHDSGKCGGGYLETLTEAFQAGMVLIVSHWSGNSGSDMGWLDIPPCTALEACDKQGTAAFYNIWVK